jgi:STE24 endopeptidase
MFPYLEWTIVFLTAVWLFETYIAYRQHRKYKEYTLPKALTGIISKEKYLKAQSYGLDKSRFGIITDGFSNALNLTILWCRWMPGLWNLSGRLLTFLSSRQSTWLEVSHLIKGKNVYEFLNLFFLNRYNNR